MLLTRKNGFRFHKSARNRPDWQVCPNAIILSHSPSEEKSIRSLPVLALQEEGGEAAGRVLPGVIGRVQQRYQLQSTDPETN